MIKDFRNKHSIVSSGFIAAHWIMPSLINATSECVSLSLGEVAQGRCEKMLIQ